MRLSEPGMYMARDGRKAIVDDYSCGRKAAVNVAFPNGKWAFLERGDATTEGEWLKVEEPTFPELPPKPPQVYALMNLCGPDWYMVMPLGDCFSRGDGWVSPHRLDVVDHPDNDPEAVALIEKAKTRATT